MNKERDEKIREILVKLADIAHNAESIGEGQRAIDEACISLKALELEELDEEEVLMTIIRTTGDFERELKIKITHAICTRFGRVRVDRERLIERIWKYLKDTSIEPLLNGRVDCINLADTIIKELEGIAK